MGISGWTRRRTITGRADLSVPIAIGSDACIAASGWFRSSGRYVERRVGPKGRATGADLPRDPVSSPRYVRRERSDGSTYRSSSAARGSLSSNRSCPAKRLRPPKYPSASLSTPDQRKRTRFDDLDRHRHGCHFDRIRQKAGRAIRAASNCSPR